MGRKVTELLLCGQGSGCERPRWRKPRSATISIEWHGNERRRATCHRTVTQHPQACRKNVIMQRQSWGCKLFDNSSGRGGEKPLSDQAEPSARALEPGLSDRVGQAVMRPFREVAARLRAALWLIVAVAVIMASLVLIAGLSKAFALIGFVSFVASVVLLAPPGCRSGASRGARAPGRRGADAPRPCTRCPRRCPTR